ncbi:MAG: hypothetical protein J3Q66DRAFT_410472, partial [Benniella sp.]
ARSLVRFVPFHCTHSTNLHPCLDIPLSHTFWVVPHTMPSQHSQGRSGGAKASILRRSRQSQSPSASTISSIPLPNDSTSAQRCYQDVLPTELWHLILELIPVIDLFSLYNTSQYMRAITATWLVRNMATKSLQLYFYQEYVRRIGIKFEFDHFDLQRDRVVFRPRDMDHQYRFKCGLTLQSPQLEEIEVKDTASTQIGSVQCFGDGRYYTTRREKAARSTIPVHTVPESTTVNNIIEPEAGIKATTIMESSTATDTVIQPANAPAEYSGGISTAEIKEGDRGVHRKPIGDEKSYQGTKNFLDRTCPLNVRKDGVHTFDGVRYCFLKEYPWSLQYQVDYEPLDTLSTSTHTNGGLIKKRSTFFIDIRKDLYSQAQQQLMEQDPAQVNVHSGDSGRVSQVDTPTTSTSSSTPLSNLPLFRSKLLEVSATVSSGKGTTSNSGPRFFRVLRFECSMNFLDPKRATRNIIGRWIEGKVQHWKKVLSVGKVARLQDQHQLNQQQQQQQQKQQRRQRAAIKVNRTSTIPATQTLYGSHHSGEGEQHQIQPVREFHQSAITVQAF